LKWLASLPVILWKPLEEKMPDLPSISPDVVGTLKTLGQIAEYMVNSLAVDESIKPEVQNKENVSFLTQAKDSGPSRIEKKNIEETLLSVVSQLTGYPVVIWILKPTWVLIP